MLYIHKWLQEITNSYKTKWSNDNGDDFLIVNFIHSEWGWLIVELIHSEWGWLLRPVSHRMIINISVTCFGRVKGVNQEKKEKKKIGMILGVAWLFKTRSSIFGIKVVK